MVVIGHVLGKIQVAVLIPRLMSCFLKGGPTIDGVPLHDFELIDPELLGVEENGVRYPHLAYVMQYRALDKVFDILLSHKFFIERPRG
jgi:hypothetical protein